jgi:hypothetical protein
LFGAAILAEAIVRGQKITGLSNTHIVQLGPFTTIRRRQDMAFNYIIHGVSDVDQRWDILPGNGAMYCVPASATNWMYYYAAHGRPSALMFPTSLPNHVQSNVMWMGSYMNTDGEDGTGWSDGIDGLDDWLHDHNVPAIVFCGRAPDNDNVTYAIIRNWLKLGANIDVAMGRYALDDGEFERKSAHRMTLVSLKRTDAGDITIGVHDPLQDEGNLNSQSSTQLKHSSLKEETRNLEGDVVKVLRWGSTTDPYRFIDGWMAILPAFAVTNLTAGALTTYTADLETGKIKTAELALPFRGDLGDLALNLSTPQVAVVAKGSGDVWTLDLAEGTWTKVPGVSSARVMAYGGRNQRLFVVRGSEIVSLDEAGSQLGVLDLGVAIDGISYDSQNDRLVVASSASKRLFAVAPKLQILGQVESPTVPGTGRLSLSVNGRDSTIVLTREGSAEAATVRWHSTGALVTSRFHLLAQGVTSAAHVNRKGRLFVNEAGNLATFDMDGNRLTGSIMDGLKLGPLFKVARSGHNLDEARSGKKAWKE